MLFACCKNWTAITLRLLDRGSASDRMRSQTGLRISKSRTYPLGWRTPEGDEGRNSRRIFKSLSMFMITTLCTGLNVNTVNVTPLFCPSCTIVVCVFMFQFHFKFEFK